MANANRRIKASPFSNTQLFPGLAPVLAPCSVNMKAQDLENIVNAWAVDYTSASALHNIRAFALSVSIIKVSLMAKGSLLVASQRAALRSFFWDVIWIKVTVLQKRLHLGFTFSACFCLFALIHLS